MAIPLRHLPIQLDVVNPGYGRIKFVKYGTTVVGEISKSWRSNKYELHYVGYTAPDVQDALEKLAADLIKTYTITDRMLE